MKDALLCMAGKSAYGAASHGASAPHQRGGVGPSARRGSSIIGADAPPDKGGDVIDIHVARSGGWWLPFLLGAGAGVVGTVFAYRYFSPPDPPPEPIFENPYERLFGRRPEHHAEHHAEHRAEHHHRAEHPYREPSGE